MTIKAGDKIPSATLMEMQDGKPTPVSTDALLRRQEGGAVRAAGRLHADLLGQARARALSPITTR